jgi:ribosomal protein S18 acetylase RimI-like enzyme
MVTVRIAIPSDRDQIEILTRLLVAERDEDFDNRRFEWGIVRRLMDPFQRQGIFLAEIEEGTDKQKKSVGMIFSELRVDPLGNSEGYIKQFFVRPKYRKKGIGKALLDAAMAHYKEIHVQVVKVNVKQGLEETFRMYSNLNFKPKCVVLQLNLNPDQKAADLDDGAEFEFQSDIADELKEIKKQSKAKK